MKIKEGVVLAGLSVLMRPVLVYADRVWTEFGQELVVTSGLDGVHSAGSLHYYGLALDLRTRYFEKGTVEEVARRLRLRLGKIYNVVVHSTHIHVEYDNGNF